MSGFGLGKNPKGVQPIGSVSPNPPAAVPPTVTGVVVAGTDKTILQAGESAYNASTVISKFYLGLSNKLPEDYRQQLTNDFAGKFVDLMMIGAQQAMDAKKG